MAFVIVCPPLPKDVYTLINGTRADVALCGKKDFSDVVKARDFYIAYYPEYLDRHNLIT